MASQGLKKFVETSSADELDESSQGADGIFDAFNGAPIPAGVGQTETQFFLDGNHTMVMHHVSNYFIRYGSGSEIVNSPINYYSTALHFSVIKDWVMILSLSLKCIMLIYDHVYFQVSLTSRIVPSPDWFVGIDSLNLCLNHQWIDSIAVDVRKTEFTLCTWFLAKKNISDESALS